MIAPHVVRQNQDGERDAARARGQLRIQAVRHRDAERKAGDILRDAICAVGVAAHHGFAILAAADSLKKAAILAALAERSDPEPTGECPDA